MAALTLSPRDLAATRQRLHDWIGDQVIRCRILRSHVLLRSLGLTDHGFLQAPILPSSAVETIR